MTDNNEVRGKTVLWRAPHGSGEKWMYFDHEPAHLPIREPLVSGADYAALLAEVEALRVDAARYRWLRESGLEIAWNAQVSYSPGYDHGDAEMMDAAIDAAMAAEGRE